MAANVESMFYVREVPWHGLGTKVLEAPASKDALHLAGLDWKVIQQPVYTNGDDLIQGYKVNVRDIDGRHLGIVSDKYRVVQNEEAFAFTDALLGQGVTYETAGSLQNGKKVWLLAKMPETMLVDGEVIDPYLVFSNTHDGSGAVRVAVTPIRVVCNNTLNLALSTAKRSWSMVHTGNIEQKMEEASQTLFRAEKYLQNLSSEILNLKEMDLTEAMIEEYISLLLPTEDNISITKKNNIYRLRNNLRSCYYDAPDLQNLSNNAYRFINAVSDFATHTDPLRKTRNYKENIFAKTVDGNPMIDKAYRLLKMA
ncbi:MAG: DUF932 domain-containing protein [Eubacteriales bacterium]|nr:DUF932 domain-containing protein [Eubacteriales bacterium]